jgi:PAS domain S-box-containing protein
MRATIKKSNNGGKSTFEKVKQREPRPARVKNVQPLKPEQFVGIIEHMNDGVVVLDRDWYYVYVNQKAAAMLQRQKPADLIGKHIWTEFPDGVGQPFQLAYEKAMREQISLVFEEYYAPWDLWFENRVYPSPESLLILFTEITDRKRTEALLKERQYLLQKILDTEPGTVYIYDLEERRNVYINRYWLLTFGYTEEETQAMGDQLLIRIFHPDDVARVSEHHKSWEHAATDNIREIEYRILTKAGAWRWLHSRDVPFTRDEAGRVKQILGITHDITERKLAQEALRESEEKFSKVFYASPIPLSINRVSDGRYVEVNGSFLDRSGFQREEVIGRTAQEMGVWVDPAEREKMMRILYEQGSLRNFEGQFRTRSGRVGTALLFREIIEIAGEKHFIGTSLDITERKQSEEAVRQERDFSDAMLNSLPGIFYFYDQNGKFLRWSQTLETVSGYSAEEIAHLSPLDFFEEQAKEAAAQKIREVFEKGESDGEANFVSKNGQLTPYYFTGRRIDIENVPYLIGMGIDITQRRYAEEELRKLNLELEQRIAARTEELAAAMIQAQESDRIKSSFLATMSHELRTPLNSIIGFTGVILQGLAGPLNDEQIRQLSMIRDSARHLLALINDILDISKIEAGQLEILQAPFEIRQAVESVLRIVQPLAQKKNLQLKIDIAVNVDTINNDRRRVEQVLINLVNNAIKFTERGEVNIVCQIRDGWLETRVRDTGIGIKPEDMHRLFKPFQQIDTGLARGHDGTGLGLAICKRLVAAMGGDISVETQWAVGSTFKFTLPL